MAKKQEKTNATLEVGNKEEVKETASICPVSAPEAE